MLILRVWLESSGDPIGHLVKGDSGELAFAYTEEWLVNPGRYPLSLSLPLGDEPFDDVPVRAYFDNLLQENDQLEVVMRREGLGRGDIAGLLEHVGADCAGAVSILPLDHPPIKRPGNLDEDYDPLDEDKFNDLIERLATGKALPDAIRDPSPVAGVRAKISLAALPEGRFGIPKQGTGAPTTHILKIPDPDHRHEARDEAFVTLLAAKCGFSVGSCTSTQIGDHEILLIRRYDREIRGNLVYRRHQEDFAQAAGLPGELKYERKGRPGRLFDAGTIGTILAATDQPARARETFLRMTLFNLLIGNNDNHAKNNALLHAAGPTTLLAPFYDIVPVQTVAGFTEELAFRIGEATVPEDVTADDLHKFCVAIGIPAAGAGKILRAAAQELVERLEEESRDFPSEATALDRLLGETLAHLDAILELGIAIRERDAHVVKGGGWNIS